MFNKLYMFCTLSFTFWLQTLIKPTMRSIDRLYYVIEYVLILRKKKKKKKRWPCCRFLWWVLHAGGAIYSNRVETTV